jgi:hypothetical protein
VKGIIDYGCVYRAGSSKPELVGFGDSDHASDVNKRKIDSDHVSDVNKRKSTFGTLFFLGSSIVSWASKK